MFNDSSAQHSTQHVNAEQYQKHKAEHDHVAKNIADLMVAGNSVDSSEVQDWIGKHYEFVSQFWTPNRIAYKSLALTYTMDPAFKATYEAYEPGLAAFIQKAINIWADANLADSPNGKN
jgi:hypothetical protein